MGFGDERSITEFLDITKVKQNKSTLTKGGKTKDTAAMFLKTPRSKFKAQALKDSSSYWNTTAKLLQTIGINVQLQKVRDKYTREYTSTKLVVSMKDKIGNNIDECILGVSSSQLNRSSDEANINRYKATLRDNHFMRFMELGWQNRTWTHLMESKADRRKQLKPVADILRDRSKYIPDNAIRLMLKTRLSVIGNKAYHHVYKMKVSPNCPRPGCEEEESPLHIFNDCPFALSQMRARHDAVQDILVREIKKHCHGDSLAIDAVVLNSNHECQDRRRPDISFAKLVKGDRVQIGEFKVPFVSNIMKNYIEAKKKYEDASQEYPIGWIPALMEQHPLENIRPDLATFVVGSMGIIHPELANEIEKYNIKTPKTVIADMVCAAIRGSHKIWMSRNDCKWNRA